MPEITRRNLLKSGLALGGVAMVPVLLIEGNPFAVLSKCPKLTATVEIAFYDGNRYLFSRASKMTLARFRGYFDSLIDFAEMRFKVPMTCHIDNIRVEMGDWGLVKTQISGQSVRKSNNVTVAAWDIESRMT